MAIPGSFDMGVLQKSVAPGPVPGQLWYLSGKGFRLISHIAATLPLPTVYCTALDWDGSATQTPRRLGLEPYSLDAFIDACHAADSGLYAGGMLVWPPQEPRKAGF